MGTYARQHQMLFVLRDAVMTRLREGRVGRYTPYYEYPMTAGAEAETRAFIAKLDALAGFAKKEGWLDVGVRVATSAVYENPDTNEPVVDIAYVREAPNPEGALKPLPMKAQVLFAALESVTSLAGDDATAGYLTFPARPERGGDSDGVAEALREAGLLPRGAALAEPERQDEGKVPAGMVDAATAAEVEILMATLQGMGFIDPAYTIAEGRREGQRVFHLADVRGVRMTPSRFHAGREEHR